MGGGRLIVVSVCCVHVCVCVLCARVCLCLFVCARGVGHYNRMPVLEEEEKKEEEEEECFFHSRRSIW